MIQRHRPLFTFLLAVLLGFGVVTLTVVSSRSAAQEANKPELRYAESLAKERLAELTKELLSAKRGLFKSKLELDRLVDHEIMEDKDVKQLTEEVAALQANLLAKQKALAARREKVRHLILAGQNEETAKKIASVRDRITALEEDEKDISQEITRIEDKTRLVEEALNPPAFLLQAQAGKSERRLANLEEQVQRLNQSIEELKELVKKGGKQTK